MTFTVDPLDRHATRTANGTTDNYGYLGPTETAWQTGSTTTTNALLDNDGSRLAIKTGTGSVAWLIFDLHGSAVALCTAGTTTLSDAYRYDGYGERITDNGSSVNPWRYRGLLNIGSDNLTWALLDMGARDYSPQLGTFTQRDSAQGKAANPLTMNRFLYALANPATLVDPDGHAALEDETCNTCGRAVIASEHNFTIVSHGTTTRHRRVNGHDVVTITRSSHPRDPSHPSAIFVRPGGQLTSNLECYQYYALACSSVVIDWGDSYTGQHGISDGWSPEEYLTGWSTASARKTLYLYAAQLRGDYGPTAREVVSAIIQVGSLTFGLGGIGAAARGATARTAFTYGDLDPGTLGATDAYTGQITVQRGLTGQALEETLRHESVHAALTSTSSTLAAARNWLYRNSSLYRYSEEALAEAYGTGSLSRGLAFPITAGYVSTLPVVAEAGGLSAAAYASSQWLGYGN